MLYRFKRKAATAWFCFNTQGIFKTAPLNCDSDSGAVFVSQVCHRDVGMYLLAVKSFARFVSASKVFILDDGSLTENDKLVLRSHIITLEILPIESVGNTICPKGGTWERLLFISDLVASSYVIQIDSDTLTLKLPKDTQSCVANDVSFTLGEWPRQEIVLAQEAVADATHRVKDGTEHVQFVAEANLTKVASEEPLRYVRGCSGFAGFARNSFSRKSVEHFSSEMARIIGQRKWSEWGSEQVTSNLIVANSPKAEVLPFPEYCFHSPDTDVESATFVHFIGSHRFHGGRYGRLARRVISQLRQS